MKTKYNVNAEIREAASILKASDYDFKGKEKQVFNREKKAIIKEFMKTVNFHKKNVFSDDVINKYPYEKYFTNSLKKDFLIDKKPVQIKIFKKLLKSKLKEYKSELFQLKDILKYKIDFKSIKIVVKWKKSKTWGANPTPEIWTNGGRCEYIKGETVGGCGYDKQSTAVANILNSHFAIKKLLLINKKNIEKIYGHHNNLFSPGVGVNCYKKIFKLMKYKFETIHDDENTEIYIITK